MSYKIPVRALARFLNNYMDDNKEKDNDYIKNKEILFNKTVDIIWNNLISKNMDIFF